MHYYAEFSRFTSKRWIFIAPLRGFLLEFCNAGWAKTSRFDTIHECDRRTDGHTRLVYITTLTHIALESVAVFWRLRSYRDIIIIIIIIIIVAR